MRLGHILGSLLSVVLIAGLSACGTTGTGVKAPAKFDSNSYTPLALNARRLEIVENWQMPMQAPYIGHYQTPYPSNIIAQWAARVLQPAGGSGEMILDISRAAVIKEKLPAQTDLKGLLTDQQNNRIRVELSARLMWLQPVGGAQAMAVISANHSSTIAESSTPNIFNQAVSETFLEALDLLDKEARKELRKIDNILLP